MVLVNGKNNFLNKPNQETPVLKCIGASGYCSLYV